MKSGERLATADRAVSLLVRLARDAATDELSPNEQGGVLRLEAALARQGLTPRPRRRFWAWGAGALSFGAAAASIWTNCAPMP